MNGNLNTASFLHRSGLAVGTQGVARMGRRGARPLRSWEFSHPLLPTRGRFHPCRIVAGALSEGEGASSSRLRSRVPQPGSWLHWGAGGHFGGISARLGLHPDVSPLRHVPAHRSKKHRPPSFWCLATTEPTPATDIRTFFCLDHSGSSITRS